MKFFVLASALLFVAPIASVAASTWGEAKTPAKGPPQAIGGYSRGCVIGAKPLPKKQRGLAIAKPERHRTFGHPALIDYVTGLADSLARKSLGGIVVGDLSQPRGGPAPSGHASHQSGLDADIWFVWPGSKGGSLSRKQKAKLAGSHPSAIVAGDTGTPTKAFTARIRQLLRLATKDPRVARVFVHPGIKRRLCEKTPKGQRAWLRKVRPWWGHRAHFHARLRCPKNNKYCEPQGSLPKGDGCDDLSWWFSKRQKAARRQGQAKYQKSVGATPPLPEKCKEIVPKG